MARFLREKSTDEKPHIGFFSKHALILTNFALNFATLPHRNIAFALPQKELLFEKEFDIAHCRIFAPGLFHVYFFSDSIITMEFTERIDQFNEACGGKAYRNLYEFEPRVDLDPEVREWAAHSSGNKKTIADALVINNLAHKLLADFYVKYNKPFKPTKVFNNRDRAVKWLMSIPE